MVEDMRGQEVFNHGLDAELKEGGLGLGVKQVGKDLVGEDFGGKRRQKRRRALPIGCPMMQRPLVHSVEVGRRVRAEERLAASKGMIEIK